MTKKYGLLTITEHMTRVEKHSSKRGMLILKCPECGSEVSISPTAFKQTELIRCPYCNMKTKNRNSWCIRSKLKNIK